MNSPLTVRIFFIPLSRYRSPLTISPLASSKSSSSSNVPAIVGSVAGVAALIIIVATTIICFRRRRRNNRELTFDTLQGMSATGAARASQRYNATALPAAGRPSVAPGGYDDGFDYDSPANQSPAQGYAAHTGYAVDNGYDAYGAPHQAYQNPSIFQEDNLAYSGAMGRNRAGYDQNLPEITYRNGNDINHPSGEATGYYDDNMYNQQVGWSPNMSGGYIGPKGLWVANPTAEHPYPQEYQPDYHPEQEGDIVMQQSPMIYEKNAIYDNSSDTVVGSASPRSKFRGHNPQALPESPRLQQLRGGDLFGQDAEAAPTSPRTAAAQVVPEESAARTATPPLSSSPRLMSRGEMRSFEMARHSPTRSSGDGVQSYASDYVAGRGSTSDRPSMDNGSNLNPGKSLRTLRREDWS
ncbi:hypothetical protein BGZ58_007156 [Dissophora ornata]|nr:hypothetical protein BGZ58_007156 [Dissophora ornata]